MNLIDSLTRKYIILILTLKLHVAFAVLFHGSTTMNPKLVLN